MLSQDFSQIESGRVKTFLCADVIDAVNQLEYCQNNRLVNEKFIIHSWQKLPKHDLMLEELQTSMAKLALRIWPIWYDEEQDFWFVKENKIEDHLLNQLRLQELRGIQRDICFPWLRSAIRACQAGQLPLFKNFSKTIQVSQLALAISPENLIVVLAACDRDPPQQRLLSLAHTSSWLARQTKARIAVLLPSELSNERELDSILYRASEFPRVAYQEINEPAEKEIRYVISPVKGKPHPFSPGEQILAQKLSQDTELSNLFSFNQTLQTCRGTQYCVDLLWLQGKVIVEIDGYRHHANHFAFVQDRHRDYELLISGYLVLRLSHDEVINDVEIAVEKIRDVVRFRNRQQSIANEAS